ncbi:hypothetical protein GUJ93_ZPchr0013g36060 [Zizania palustris]|uniref:Uncharacterized protein n=1 Tax=Zizania palustris TaxID=103762 RepID=A0A8J5WSD0_ZIZPA|nr:hypothetical protein GUJ93_ZPchr0013g36060 [Zizania palustris]
MAAAQDAVDDDAGKGVATSGGGERSGAARKPWIVIPGCQGCHALGTPDPGYGVRTSGPLSLTRLYPSAVDLLDPFLIWLDLLPPPLDPPLPFLSSASSLSAGSRLGPT